MKRKFVWGLAILYSLPSLFILFDAFVERGAGNLHLLYVYCALGLPAACTELGWLHYTGRVDVPVDLKQAQRYLQTACDSSHGLGCRYLAILYSRPPSELSPYEIKMGIRKVPEKIQDLAKAVQFYQRACDIGDAESCNELGNMLFHGRGVAQDHEQAIQRWLRACNVLSHNSSCFDLGRAYYAKGDETKALVAYSMAERRSLPLLFLLWLASFVASLITGIVVMRVEKEASSPQPRLWISMSILMACFYVLAGISALSLEQSSALIGCVLLGIAVAIVIGIFQIRGNQDRAARILFAVTGFLALPPGLFLILISREIVQPSRSSE